MFGSSSRSHSPFTVEFVLVSHFEICWQWWGYFIVSCLYIFLSLLCRDLVGTMKYAKYSMHVLWEYRHFSLCATLLFLLCIIVSCNRSDVFGKASHFN